MAQFVVSFGTDYRGEVVVEAADQEAAEAMVIAAIVAGTLTVPVTSRNLDDIARI